MLADSLEFPRAGEDWLQTILIGGVLSLLSFLIIPGIIVNGYLIGVLRASIEGAESPPVFEEWVDLLVDGILVWVIQFVYVGIPTFLLVVVVGSFTLIASVGTSGGPLQEPGAGAIVGGLISLVFFAGVVLLLLVAIYLLPAALANFARTGEFTAAFHLGTIAKAAFSVDYFVAMVLVIAVSMVLGFIGGLLTVILVGIFVLFYLQMVVYYLFGQGFARGSDLNAAA